MPPPSIPKKHQETPVKKFTKKTKGKKKSSADVSIPEKKSKKNLAGETVEDHEYEYGAESTYGESIYEDFDA